jgi:GTP cyclohydrolase II
MPEKQAAIPQDCIASHLHTERAIDELRRQAGLIIQDDNGHAVGNYPAEFLNEETLARLRSPQLHVLITGTRAHTLGLAAQDMKIDAGNLSLAQIMALCDPVSDQSALPKMQPVPASDIDSMALRLAKYASILPALLLVSDKAAMASWPVLSVQDMRRYIAMPLVDMIQTAQAALPIEGAEHTRVVSFRSFHSTEVHLALVVGQPAQETAPLTRIHSSCVTGDILGSLRCDCGTQLKRAVEQIILAGSGVLVYLHQEGRGIGITNKLRAYQLQEKGIDTYQANLMLGYGEDERDFSLAAAILKKIGIGTIRMLTNNPHKMAAMEKAGIKVAQRIPLIAASGQHNHAYLDAKARFGHLFQ